MERVRKKKNRKAQKLNMESELEGEPKISRKCAVVVIGSEKC